VKAFQTSSVSIVQNVLVAWISSAWYCGAVVSRKFERIVVGARRLERATLEAMRRGMVAAACAAACACGHRGFERNAITSDAMAESDASDDADGDATLEGCAASPDLLAYWPMDEGTGTVVGDLSRHQVAGDMSGAAVWTAGRIGSAVQFTKSPGGTIHLRSTSNFSFGGGTGSFTFSYWVSPSSQPPGTAPRLFQLAFCGTMSSYIYTRLQSDYSADLAGYDTTGTYAVTDSGPGVAQIDQWTHVVHVIDRTTDVGLTYINGAQSGTSGDLSGWSAIIDCSQAMDVANIGGWAGLPSSYYDGRIDDVRIYGRALTAQEVATLAAVTTTGCPF
jgi:hypothetical protein